MLISQVYTIHHIVYGEHVTLTVPDTYKARCNFHSILSLYSPILQDE